MVIATGTGTEVQRRRPLAWSSEASFDRIRGFLLPLLYDWIFARTKGGRKSHRGGEKSRALICSVNGSYPSNPNRTRNLGRCTPSGTSHVADLRYERVAEGVKACLSPVLRANQPVLIERGTNVVLNKLAA
jgi:hypothetical protein